MPRRPARPPIEPALRFRVIIECENAAFEESPAEEIARILRAIADRVQRGDCNGYDNYQTARDINGNPVGSFRLRLETEDRP